MNKKYSLKRQKGKKEMQEEVEGKKRRRKIKRKKEEGLEVGEETIMITVNIRAWIPLVNIKSRRRALILRGSI